MVLSLQTRPRICIAHISFFIAIITSVSALCVEHNATRRSLPVTFASQQREHSRLSMAPSRNSLLSLSLSLSLKSFLSQERERKRGCRAFLILLPVETHYRAFTFTRYVFVFSTWPDENGHIAWLRGETKCSRIYETRAIVARTNSRALKMNFKHEGM